MNTLKSNLIVLLVSLISLEIIFATNTYTEIDLGGNDQAKAFVQQPDSSLIFCGTSDRKLFVLKTTQNGEKLWSYSFQDTSEGFGVAFNQKNEIIAVGAKLNDNYNALAVKLNQEGKVIWEKEYVKPNIFIGYSVASTNDNDFIIVGQSRTESNSDSDLSYFKINNSGEVVWDKKLDWGDLDWGKTIKPTSDGNFAIVGVASAQYCLVKINVNGDILFKQTYDDFINAYGASDFIELNNKYYLLGGAGLIKTETNGIKIQISNTGSHKFTYHNNYFYASSSETLSPLDNYLSIVIKKIDLDGKLIFKRKHPIGRDDWGYDILTSLNNEIICTGTTLNNGNHNIPILYLNEYGYPLNIKNQASISNSTIYPNPIKTGEYLNITVTNSDIIKILNIQGNIIFEKKVVDNIPSLIPTAGLKPGVYVVKIEERSGNNSYEKILIK